MNFEGTFLTAKTWLWHVRECAAASKVGEKRMDNVSLIIVSSENGHLGRKVMRIMLLERARRKVGW